jgi:hypothetical protein
MHYPALEVLLVGARPMVVYLAREGKIAARRSGMRQLPSSFRGAATGAVLLARPG